MCEMLRDNRYSRNICEYKVFQKALVINKLNPMNSSQIKYSSVLSQSCPISCREIQRDHYIQLKSFWEIHKYINPTLSKSVEYSSFVPVITTQQRLPFLQVSTQPSATEGDSSTCILCPKRPCSIRAQWSGQQKHYKP